MKTNGPKFGTRFFTGLFAISIALLLIIPSSRPSAETPQGTNGEAKPKSTKSRARSNASSRSTSKVASLVGTVWDYKSGDVGQVSHSYEFLAGGKMKYDSTGSATWTQTGNRVVITFTPYLMTTPYLVETAIITGDRMIGTGRYKNNN